ncbi:MAG: (2Fe-2S)-binding protein [Acidimicrobiales bacterium]
MYICHCLAVTDRSIRAAIEAGAGDVDEIGEGCGAGTGCGGCHLALRQLLAEYGLASFEQAGLGQRRHAGHAA